MSSSSNRGAPWLERACRVAVEGNVSVENVLLVLDNADFGSSQNSAVQFVAFTLGEEDLAVLLAVHLGEEGRLVSVGVEFSSLPFERIKSLNAVLFQGRHEDAFCHHESGVQVSEMLGGFRGGFRCRGGVGVR